MNIIIGESNECNAKLIKYVAQFGSVTSYSFLSEGYIKEDIESHLKGVVGNMTFSNTTLSIAIYNMYDKTHLQEIIKIFKDEFNSFENMKLVNFNFDVSELTTYIGYNVDETVEFIGEELNNVAELKTAMDSAFTGGSSPRDFTNVEIELYIYTHTLINLFFL